MRKADFNFYAQIAAQRFGINAVYKNGDTRHVNLEIEGDEAAVRNFVHFMRSGPLQAYIEKFRMETGTFVNIRGFTSLRVHKDKRNIIKRLFEKKQKMYSFSFELQLFTIK